MFLLVLIFLLCLYCKDTTCAGPSITLVTKTGLNADPWTVVTSFQEYMVQSTNFRARCADAGWVPLYHYTQRSVGNLIHKHGLRVSKNGQGGVFFSAVSPAALSLGTAKYEESLILEILGPTHVARCLGKHLFDLVVVYGMVPKAIESVNGKSTAMFVAPNSTIKSLSLPQPDGNYFLRADRILGMLLIDSDERFTTIADVIDTEARRDVEIKQTIEALLQDSSSDESELENSLRKNHHIFGNESSESLLKVHVDDFSWGGFFNAVETPMRHTSAEDEFRFELPERFSRASAYNS